MNRCDRKRRREAIAKYRATDKALQDNSRAGMARGIDYETPEFLRLNSEAWAARDALPWWLRWVLR